MQPLHQWASASLTRRDSRKVWIWATDVLLVTLPRNRDDEFLAAPVATVDPQICSRMLLQKRDSAFVSSCSQLTMYAVQCFKAESKKIAMINP